MNGEKTTYLLFPHPKEPEAAVGAANRHLSEAPRVRTLAGGFARKGHPGSVGADPAFWWLSTVATDPLTVVTALRRVDWRHAPLLVYRSVTDESWSYLRITRRVAPLWGDEGEED